MMTGPNGEHEEVKEQKNDATGERRDVFRRLWERVVFAWRWLRAPNAIGQPVILQPRSVRLLLLLIVGNLTALALLAVALYQATTMPTDASPTQAQGILAPAPESSATPAPTPTPLGTGGAIAFSLRRNGNTDIYALNQNDRQLVRLTHHQAEDRSPAWSPDGDYIAFASNRGGNWDIYLLDLLSGALIRLTRHRDFDANPSWSPDGQWIAFETYRDGNLDIYLMSTTGRQLRAITRDPSPDYAPDWAPDNRAIAFTSLRDGSKDIHLRLLSDSYEVLNLTQSPDVDEDSPAWSVDGGRLAYVSGPQSRTAVQVTPFEWGTLTADQTETEFFGTGDAPTWAPDGESLAYVYERSERSHLVVASMAGWALFHEAYSTEGLLDDLAWTNTPLSPRVVARAQEAAPDNEPPFYTEVVQATPATGAPYELVPLPGVESDDGEPLLSDRVNNSFNALRRRVAEEAGWDFLGEMDSSWIPLTYEPPSGQSRKSWHLCGRAFALNRAAYGGREPEVELVREDIGTATYWRVFVRATEGDRHMGEPLRVLPWDLDAREEGGQAAVNGGAPRTTVPSGYYVDFTARAHDYGWERVPALWRWRQFWPDIQWWEFRNTGDLTWWDCMLEVHEVEEVESAFGPIPGQRD
jgi:TolB protein